MHKHSAGRNTSIFRAEIYMNEGQAEIVKEEMSGLKKIAGHFGEKKSYSRYFLDIWLQYRDCKIRTGLSIKQLVDEYLRLKALSKA